MMGKVRRIACGLVYEMAFPAALKASTAKQICCRNFHKTLDFSLQIWYPI